MISNEKVVDHIDIYDFDFDNVFIWGCLYNSKNEF
jgi:hypothetical protein